MDSDLNVYIHIKTITKLAYYHLRNISRIRRLISQQDLERRTYAIPLLLEGAIQSTINLPAALPCLVVLNKF